MRFPRAEAVGREVGRRVAVELGLPVFLYGSLGEGRRPAYFRRGGPEELQRRIDAGELAPAYGPRQLDPRSGAVLVGVRPALVAFNLELVGPLEVAQEVAAAVRESSGGLPGVQALGLQLAQGIVQVSTNVVDLSATPLHVLVERIAQEAAARGARVGSGRARRAAPRGERRPGRSRCIRPSRRARRPDPSRARGGGACASPGAPRAGPRARVAPGRLKAVPSPRRGEPGAIGVARRGRASGAVPSRDGGQAESRVGSTCACRSRREVGTDA